ncbi:MAG: hypothetical protein FWH46_02610, partial [Methanimicrococcus sp.]|nr:hypothetical protein [Methanimicrococcus sp.]
MSVVLAGYIEDTIPAPFNVTSNMTGVDLIMAPGGTITIHVQYYINNTHDPTLDTNISVGAIMVYEANIPVPSGYRIQSTSPALPVQMNDGDILSVYIAVRTSGSGFGNATIVPVQEDTQEEPMPPESNGSRIDDTPPDTPVDTLLKV